MPNTREKLIELVDDYTETLSARDIHQADFAEKFVDHLIANGVTVAYNLSPTEQKWIPVTERLPEIVSTHKRYRSTVKKSIRVLCVCVQKSGKTMVKEGYCEWYNDYPEPRWQIPGTIDTVTHWMPLPEPPKGE